MEDQRSHVEGDKVRFLLSAALCVLSLPASEVAAEEPPVLLPETRPAVAESLRCGLWWNDFSKRYDAPVPRDVLVFRYTLKPEFGTFATLRFSPEVIQQFPQAKNEAEKFARLEAIQAFKNEWMRINTIQTYRATDIDCFVYGLLSFNQALLGRLNKVEATIPEQIREIPNTELSVRIEILEGRLTEMQAQLKELKNGMHNKQ